MTLFQEECATNLARHEAITVCLDTLIKDLTNSKVDVEETVMVVKVEDGKVKQRLKVYNQ